MPAYHLPRITPTARQAALRALDAALETPVSRRSSPPLSGPELLEISIIDDALDHHLAPQLPR